MMKLEKREYFYLITLLCLSLFFFFFRLWGFNLFDVDEPRYAEAAREMIEKNNWITPYFNYDVRFDKPVLFYWLIAISYKIFGVSEFAARFPSALLATIAVISIYFFGRHFINAKFGFISALVTLTSIQFIGLARMSITDMTLSVFISLMLLAGFTAAHSPEPSKKYWWYSFYILAALGMLTKGPVAPAMAVIVLGPYFLLTGQFISVLKSCRLLIGILLFALVAIPWYLLVILENGQAYIDQFIIVDNIKRFTSTVSGHKGPIYFFVIVVAVGFIPWSTFLPYALYRYLKPVFGAYKKTDKPTESAEVPEEGKQCSLNAGFCPFIKLYNVVISPVVSVYKDNTIVNQLSLFSLIWFLAIFIFFSLSGTKLLTYVLPLFPALGLIGGKLWYDYIEDNEPVNQKAMLASSILFLMVVLVLSYLFVFKFNVLMPRDAKVLDLGSVKIYSAIVLIAGSVSSLIFLYLKHKTKAFASIVVMMVFVGIVALYGVVPKVNYAAQGHLNRLIYISKNYSDINNIILTYGMVKPSIVFYTRQRVEHVEPTEQDRLAGYLNKPDRIFIITRVRFLDELSKFSNVYIIDKGRRFALVTNKKIDEKIKKLLLESESQ
jgi:4-amino-4-deoxy-L-arabinose transferase-like glycosyltransferase